MEIWKLLFILVVVCALGTFGVFTKWRSHRRMPFWLKRSHLKHVTYEGFGGGFGVGFNGGFGVGGNGGFGSAIPPSFGSIGLDDKKTNRILNESLYGGGFGVGFNGGFGVGANGGFGDAIEPNFGSIGVDDKRTNRVVSEAFHGGAGGGGHGGGGHGGWHGPGGYGGPNQGTWRGWGGDGGGWYGWSYPWAWYGPVDVAVECYSNADCDEKSFCGSNGYCTLKEVDVTVPVGVPDVI